MAVCSLTILDGMGDGVTAAGGVLLLVLALVLAWLSTHVSDRGDHILGTILTVGAHASLIGLGGHDSYSGGPASTDTPEQQTTPPSQENKPEEELESELGVGSGEGAAYVRTEQLVNIQSKQSHSGRCNPSDDDDGDDEEGSREELNEVRMRPKLYPVFSNKSTTTTISVRLKFLNDTEKVAILKPHDTVGLLKSKYFSGQECQIKLIYQGQLLQDSRRTLLSLNITHNSVIHCHISQVLHEASSEEEDPSRAGSGISSGVASGIRAAGLALSTSSLVVPVFVVILAVVWYFRINYRQLFTAPATISLVGVTVIFSFLIFEMHIR